MKQKVDRKKASACAYEAKKGEKKKQKKDLKTSKTTSTKTILTN